MQNFDLDDIIKKKSEWKPEAPEAAHLILLLLLIWDKRSIVTYSNTSFLILIR